MTFATFSALWMNLISNNFFNNQKNLMKRYLLYYKIGSLKFYLRVFFPTVEEAKDFVTVSNAFEWKIFDIFKGEFVESSK